MTWINFDHMHLALAKAEASKLNGEFPFGAVIARGDTVLVAVENEEKRQGDVTAHAEIVAISAACRLLGRRDLSDCDLYSSTEPCPMCASAIFFANIPRIAFSLYREDLPHLFRRRNIRIAQLAEDWDYEPEVIGGVLRDDAMAAFAGLEKPWRVAGQYHQAQNLKRVA